VSAASPLSPDDDGSQDGLGGDGSHSAGLQGAGLHSERTRLAWVRTATTLAGAGLVTTGAGLRDGESLGLIVPFALAALSGSALLLRTGARYRRVERALKEGAPLDDTTDGRLAWAGVLCVAAGALVLILTR
jgi:putative membrane protein